jgi:hypothetical protein
VNPEDTAQVLDIVRREIRNADTGVLVRQLQGRQYASGVATVTWTAGVVDSSVVTVPHGLDGVPSAVQVADGGGARWCVVETSSWTATTFAVQASARETTGGLAAGSQLISWVAVP